MILGVLYVKVFLKLVDADGGLAGVVDVPDREFHPKVGIDGVIMDGLLTVFHRRCVFFQRQVGGIVGKACYEHKRRKMMVWRRMMHGSAAGPGYHRGMDESAVSPLRIPYQMHVVCFLASTTCSQVSLVMAHFPETCV